MSTSTIITTTTVTAAAATIMTTTRTRYSPPGARETTHKYTEAELNAALTALGDVTLGTVLRAKGASFRVQTAANGCSYVPGAPRSTAARPTTPAVCASSAPSWTRSASLPCSA